MTKKLRAYSLDLVEITILPGFNSGAYILLSQCYASTSRLLLFKSLGTATMISVKIISSSGQIANRKPK